VRRGDLEVGCALGRRWWLTLICAMQLNSLNVEAKCSRLYCVMVCRVLLALAQAPDGLFSS
jgi:hypothetical protein